MNPVHNLPSYFFKIHFNIIQKCYQVSWYKLLCFLQVEEMDGRKAAITNSCHFFEVSVADNSADLYQAFEVLVNECRRLQGNANNGHHKSRKFSVSKMIGTLIGSGNNSNGKNGSVGNQTQQQNQGGTVVVFQISDLYRNQVLKRRQKFTATASLWPEQDPAGPSDNAMRCATVVPWDDIWSHCLTSLYQVEVRPCRHARCSRDLAISHHGLTLTSLPPLPLFLSWTKSTIIAFVLARRRQKIIRRCWVQVGIILLLKNAGDTITRTWHKFRSGNGLIRKLGAAVSVWCTASSAHNHRRGNLFASLLHCDVNSGLDTADITVIVPLQSWITKATIFPASTGQAPHGVTKKINNNRPA